jgi:hypothetical protein
MVLVGNSVLLQSKGESWPLVFASFPIYHFTPHAFQDINMPLIFSRENRFMEKQPSCEYLTDEFGKDSFIAGILMMSF